MDMFQILTRSFRWSNRREENKTTPKFSPLESEAGAANSSWLTPRKRVKAPTASWLILTWVSSKPELLILYKKRQSHLCRIANFNLGYKAKVISLLTQVNLSSWEFYLGIPSQDASLSWPKINSMKGLPPYFHLNTTQEFKKRWISNSLPKTSPKSSQEPFSSNLQPSRQ